MNYLPTPNVESERFDWSAWIEVKDAAARLGVDRSHLARRCKNTLEAQGFAVQATPPEGGKKRWFVARLWKPRELCTEVRAANGAANLDGFTEQQRRLARQRRDCVIRFRTAREAAGANWRSIIVDALSEAYPDLKVSERSLYEWDRKFNCRADVTKLIDKRGGDRKSKGDSAAWEHFGKLYLRQSQPSKKDCWRRTKRFAEAEGLKWCSYDSVKRQLNDRFPLDLQAAARDPNLYRQHFAPYIAQDPERFSAGECWVGDHSQLDFWCYYGKELKRLWVTTFQDWRSRRIVGYVLTDSPSSHSIRGALRHALMDPINGGPPDALWIDNGKDFDSWVLHGQTKKARRERAISSGYIDEMEFRGILNDFDPPIEAHFSLPFNPNGKSRMERWYGTMHGLFDKNMTTYCGRNPQFKPEGLEDLLKNRPEQIPSFEKVNEDFADFVAWHNSNTDHSIDDLREAGRLLSPDEAMLKWRERRKVFVDPEILDQLMMHWNQPVTVGRNGVKLRLGSTSLNYGATEHALSRFKAAKQSQRQKVVLAFDPHDLRQVKVYDEKRQFVCIAQQNELGGMSDALSMDRLRKLMRDKAAYNRQRKAMQEHIDPQFMTDAEALQAQMARDQAEAQSQANYQPVRTSLDGQGKAIKRDELRKAAGAETTGGPRDGDTYRGMPSPLSFTGFDDSDDDDHHTDDGDPFDLLANPTNESSDFDSADEFDDENELELSDLLNDESLSTDDATEASFNDNGMEADDSESPWTALIEERL